MLDYVIRGERSSTGPAERRRLATSVNARLYGFTDRGVLAPGMRADINVIDLDRLVSTPSGLTPNRWWRRSAIRTWAPLRGTSVRRVVDGLTVYAADYYDTARPD